MAAAVTLNPRALQDEFLERLDARLQELQPAVEEHQGLLDLRDRVRGPGTSPSPRRVRVTTPRASVNGSDTATRGPGRTDDGLGRFLDLVREHPGITVAEAYKALGYKKPNYVYKLRSRALTADPPLLRTEGSANYPID